MIIYLSGKITGDDDYEAKFAKEEQKLRNDGHIVLNPASLPEGLPQDKYLPICMSMLDAADAIYMLDDWLESKGAIIERDYAVYQGKEVFDSYTLKIYKLLGEVTK